jgi:hypothetical protein
VVVVEGVWRSEEWGGRKGMVGGRGSGGTRMYGVEEMKRIRSVRNGEWVLVFCRWKSVLWCC